MLLSVSALIKNCNSIFLQLALIPKSNSYNMLDARCKKKKPYLRKIVHVFGDFSRVTSQAPPHPGPGTSGGQWTSVRLLPIMKKINQLGDIEPSAA
jgi:hypothetical protein